MQTIKTFRNVIIILVSGFVSLLLLNYVKTNQDKEVLPTSPNEVVVEDHSFTSLKGVEIFVDSISEGSLVKSPLKITGRAPGNWFFEASAPVTLTNWDGVVLANSYMTAQGEWMTTDYVPFEGEIDFSNTNYGDYGFLILKKDNPSGMPENDDSIEIKVLFK
jgi:hypothetical protein